ncbi:TIGR03086 family metal-binding protein [Nocardioides sp. MAHUQ-72]|uniref:TIGR03086 family metal-binding protein n=1 Tax=unclassified Nocardioides TaxID=2615069 RepID=UPI003610ECB2
MTSPNDAVVVLSRALDQAGDVLAAVHPDQLTRPTPCNDWDVARLIAHLVAAPTKFLAAMRGEEPDWATEPPEIGHEWAPVFRVGADDLIHAWHQQGDEADARTVDWQTSEIAVHTWDLARATGQSAQLEPSVAERALAFMSAGLTPENRGNAFGAEVDVADDAPVYHRLAAFAGRQLDEAWVDGKA